MVFNFYLKGVFGMDQTQQHIPNLYVSETTTLQETTAGIVKTVFKESFTDLSLTSGKEAGVWVFELDENPEKIEKVAKCSEMLVSITGTQLRTSKDPLIPEVVMQANEEVYTYYQRIINQIRVKLLSFSYASNIYCGFEINTEVGKTNIRTLRKLCQGLVEDLYTVQPQMTTYRNPFFLDTDIFDALYNLKQLIKPFPTSYYDIDEWLALVAKYECLIDGLTRLGNAIMKAHDSLHKIGREICVTVRIIRDFYQHMVEREKELRGYNEQVTT